MLEEGLAGFERARADLARRVDSEIQALRSDASRRAEASTERLLARAEAAGTAEPVIAEALEKALARTRSRPGERARIRGSKTAGVVLSLDPDTAWLEVAGKRMRVARVELEPLGGAEPSPAKKRGPVAAPVAGPEPVNTATLEVNVIGQRIEDALPEIEKRLDEALLSGAGRLRIASSTATAPAASATPSASISASIPRSPLCAPATPAKAETAPPSWSCDDKS